MPNEKAGKEPAPAGLRYFGNLLSLSKFNIGLRMFKRESDGLILV